MASSHRGDKKRKTQGWILIIFAVTVAIITASRTVIMLVPVGAIIAYFSSIKMRGEFTRRHVNQLIGALVFLGVGIAAFVLDIFGIQTLFFRTQLGQRYVQGNAPTLTEDGRWINILFFLENMDKSIWGGGYSRTNVGNLHNVYLNVFDLSGIIPFTLLVFFTISILRDF